MRKDEPNKRIEIKKQNFNAALRLVLEAHKVRGVSQINEELTAQSIYHLAVALEKTGKKAKYWQVKDEKGEK